MYLIKTPRFVQRLFPHLTWKIKTEKKEIFLTFDDGPIPEVTPWVLELLSSYNAKGTFFCVGDNVTKHPHLYKDIINQGHSVGNHTFNHLNGWRSDYESYSGNVKRCANLVKSNLFRPPYGRLRPRLTAYLLKYYKIVMWDVLSGDFDLKLAPEKCFKNIISHTRKGSIIVLHDSIKAERNLRYVLPRLLEYYHQKGFSFVQIPMQ